MPITYIIRGGQMRDSERCQGVPTKGFLDNGFEICEAVTIVEVWKPCVSYDVINLLLGLALNLRVKGHGQEESGEDTDRLDSKSMTITTVAFWSSRLRIHEA